MDEDCLDLFLDWGYDDVVVKSEYANDTGDFMISDDNEYYDDAVLPLTTTSTATSTSTASPLITSPSATTTTVIKQEVSSSSSSSSSWQYISPNQEDMPNTKALLFGSNDSKNQFTFPSIEIFPAVISGPWNDPNYYGSDDEDDDEDISNANSKKKRKRQRAPNPDYELITAATETNLRLLNINPDSKEGKAQRRRIRNKISAQMHRERKKAYIVYLENIVRHRESTILNMKERIDKLLLENDELKVKINKVGNTNTKETIPTKINDHDYTTEYVTSSDDDEDTNSIHSKGTTSSLSISSPMSDPSSSKFGSKFSLFSILFMFGFTFFGPLNPVNNTGSGVSLFQAPSLLGYSNVVNRDSLLQLAPPGLTSDYVSDSDVQVSGRVLLSLPTEGSTDTMINTPSPLPKLKITPVSSLSIPSVSKSKSLWKYQDRVMHLFPKLALPDPTTQGVGKRRHLRSRDSHPSTNYETALVPIYPTSYDFDETDTKSKSQPSTLPSSISRVLLTEGKALLDPTLASGRVVQHENKSQDKAGLSLALSSWSSSDTSSHYQSSHANPVYSVSVRPQDSNVLVMLLPANQIRWGKSWEEGKDTISSGLDFEFPTENINGYSKDDIDSAWVEIGCSVFKAQLVKNITMI